MLKIVFIFSLLIFSNQMQIASKAIFDCNQENCAPLISAYIPQLKISNVHQENSIIAKNIIVDPKIGRALLLDIENCKKLGLVHKFGGIKLIDRNTAKYAEVYESAKVTFYDLEKPQYLIESSFFIACEEGKNLKSRIGLEALLSVFDMQKSGENLYVQLKEQNMNYVRLATRI